MAKWTNYRLVDDGTRVCDVLNGDTDAVYTPRYRITSDENVGVIYKIHMVNSSGLTTADRFYTSRSYDGGSTYTVYDAANGTSTSDNYYQQTKLADSEAPLGKFDSWYGIDEGVEVRIKGDPSILTPGSVWDNDDDYGFTATLQNQINNKIFDGGWHYQIEAPYSQSSQTFYSKTLPIQWDLNRSLMLAYNSYGLMSMKNTSSASGTVYGVTITAQYSTDGTEWYDGPAFATDVLSHDHVGDGMNLGIVDPDEGGKARFFRIKVSNVTTNARLNARNCYWTYSLYLQ